MSLISEVMPALKTIYAENDYPSDRLIADASALKGFVDELKSRTGKRFPEKVVAAELYRIRKDKQHTGGLPRVGRAFTGPKFRRSGK